MARRRNGERHIARGKLVWDFEAHDMPGSFMDGMREGRKQAQDQR